MIVLNTIFQLLNLYTRIISKYAFLFLQCYLKKFYIQVYVCIYVYIYIKEKLFKCFTCLC